MAHEDQLNNVRRAINCEAIFGLINLLPPDLKNCLLEAQRRYFNSLLKKRILAQSA